MKQKKIDKIWNENSANWCEASEKGYDIWRDYLNTPAFLAMLPDLTCLSGLEIGCGDGYNSRLIAETCKSLISVDISDEFLRYNKKKKAPANLLFKKADASRLPFPDQCFDFVVALMSFMDMDNLEKVLDEVYRVLTDEGFLQFSIIHPCFNENYGQWQKNKNNEIFAFAMKDYYKETHGEIYEWQHYKSPEGMKKFKVPRFFKPLNKWFNLIIRAGFVIEEISEPYAAEAAIEKYPELASSRIVAHSLIVRVKKTSNNSWFVNKLVEKIPVNLWWKNNNLRYIGCNDRVLQFLGLKNKEQLIGKSDHEVWGKKIADKLMDADLYVLSSGKSISLEETIMEKNGKAVVMLTNKSPLYDKNDKIFGVVGSSVDITERKEMELALIEAKEKAEIANKAKTEFILNMEHDIRTPFSGIYSMAEILFTQEEDAEKKEILSSMMGSAKELLEYCNSIIQLIESETKPSISKKFSIKRLINHVVKMEEPCLFVKNLKFFVEYADDLPNVVVGDEHRVEKVLLNLIGNAIKYTEVGYIKVFVERLKSRHEKEIVLRIYIKDTGIGIPKDKQTGIFERFAHVTPSYANPYKGIGLGLFITKQFINELNGDLELQSEPGKGTTFCCTIPFELPLIDDLAFNEDGEDDLI